jgi:hypothetical protein
MPIVDVELVCTSEAEFRSVSAAALADAVGDVLGSAPGHTWLRLRWLSDTCYAENASAVLPAGDLPVFVTVLHAQLPEPAALDAEVSALTLAVAGAVARPAGRVHVLYAPAAAGRQAFGGHLVR